MNNLEKIKQLSELNDKYTEFSKKFENIKCEIQKEKINQILSLIERLKNKTKEALEIQIMDETMRLIEIDSPELSELRKQKEELVNIIISEGDKMLSKINQLYSLVKLYEEVNVLVES